MKKTPGNPAKNTAKTPALSKEEDARRKYRRRRVYVRTGQIIMLAGAIILIQHWLAHIGMFGAQPPFWLDMLIGYPAGGLILIIGAITASHKPQ